MNAKKINDDILKSKGFGADLLLIFQILSAGYSFFLDIFSKKKRDVEAGTYNFVIVPGHDAINDCGAPNLVKLSNKDKKANSGPLYETGAIASAINFMSASYYRLMSDEGFVSQNRLIFLSNWDKFKVYSSLKKNKFVDIIGGFVGLVGKPKVCLIQVHFDIASTTFENAPTLSRVNKHVIYYHSDSGKEIADAICSALANKNRNISVVHDSEHRSGRIGFVRDTKDVALLIEFGYVNSSDSLVSKFSSELVEFLVQYQHD